jgi:hypothetical protein
MLEAINLTKNYDGAAALDSLTMRVDPVRSSVCSAPTEPAKRPPSISFSISYLQRQARP